MPQSARALDPQKLGDPLRTVRWWGMRVILYGSLAAIGLLVVALGKAAAGRQTGIELVLAGIFLGITLPMLLIVCVILPRRETNAFYLRSFRTDRETLPVRQAIQARLGSRYRLSGIRDPKRRRSLLDYMAFTIFLLRYSTPRFMNLEAGSDWKHRLCASLAGARCVFIDVRQMTPFLAAEIDLASHCVGLSRILFVADPSRTEEDWRREIAQHMPPSLQQTPIQIAVWDGSRGVRRRFAEDVGEFASRLPAEPALQSQAALGRAGEIAEPAGTEYLHGVQFMASSAAVTLFAAGSGLGLSLTMPPLGSAFQSILYSGIFAVLIWLFVDYLVHCATPQRVAIGCVLALCLTWYGGLFWYFVAAPVVRVRERTQLTLDADHLKRVGASLWQHLDAYGSLPPRASAIGTQAQLSWQSALLPFLEHDKLAAQIDLNRSWDSPENRPVFSTIVAEYRAAGVKPSHDAQGLAVSHFAGNALVVGGRTGLRFQDFVDGTGSTFVAGQVEEGFQPWGNPDNHRAPANGVKRGPESFGRKGFNGTLLLMADGSVRTVSAAIDTTIFEALGTPAGGEAVYETILDSIPDVRERASESIPLTGHR